MRLNIQALEIIAFTFVSRATAKCEPLPGVNLVPNPGFENPPQPGDGSYYPWNVDNGCEGDDRRTLSLRKRCPSSGKRISPGENSMYALQGNLNTDFGDGPNRICTGATDIDVNVDGTCVGHLYTMTYSYRIPPQKKAIGNLTLETSIGDYVSKIAVVPNSAWQAFPPVPFVNELFKDSIRLYDTPQNQSQIEVRLGQAAKCKDWNYNAVLQLDNFKIVPGKPKRVAPGAANLVRNGGFESGSLDPWLLQSNVPKAGIVSPGDKSKYAFMHTGVPDTINDGYGQSTLSQTLSLTRGRTYIVRFDFLSRNQTTKKEIVSDDTNAISIALGGTEYRLGLNNYENGKPVDVWLRWERAILARADKEKLSLTFYSDLDPVAEHQIYVDNVEVLKAED